MQKRSDADTIEKTDAKLAAAADVEMDILHIASRGRFPHLMHI